MIPEGLPGVGKAVAFDPKPDSTPGLTFPAPSPIILFVAAHGARQDHTPAREGRT